MTTRPEAALMAAEIIDAARPHIATGDVTWDITARFADPDRTWRTDDDWTHVAALAGVPKPDAAGRALVAAELHRRLDPILEPA